MERFTYRTWVVSSFTDPDKEYYVWFDKKGFHCSCTGHVTHPHSKCKHIRHVMATLSRALPRNLVVREFLRALQGCGRWFPHE